MKKTLIFYTLFLLSCILHAQTTEDDIIESIRDNFYQQCILFPQEKIYVQSDKSYYISGETVWLRAYKVDAQSLIPDTISRYIYAELINPMDSIISQIKIRPTSGVYQGHISLPEDLAGGNYLLRFYTKYMEENTGESYSFKRLIQIGNPLSAIYRTEVTSSFDQVESRIHAKLSFVRISDNTRINPELIRVKTKSQKKLRTIKPDEEGYYNISTDVSDSFTNNMLYVEYTYGDKTQKEYVSLPILTDDFDVSFFPEGGNLVPNIHNRIAFKALGRDGFGKEIKGYIINDSGDTISQFESGHLGMGTFYLNVSPQDKVYAVCQSGSGLEKRFDLSSLTQGSLSLQTVWQKDHLFVHIRKSSQFIAHGDYYIAVHNAGQLLSIIKWNGSDNSVAIEKTSLPSGIINVLLIDSNKNPISERLCFNINRENLADVSFTTNKASYKTRDKIKARLKLNDNDNQTNKAYLSVSITDDKDIQPEATVNILSTLLLTSELRGHIESPAYYFIDTDNAKLNKLDILMMTQGWCRYDVSKLLKEEYSKPSVMPESSLRISGSVKGGFFMNKTSAGYPVIMFTRKHAMFGETFTNDNGHFVFKGFELPDSTEYIIQGQTSKGKSGVELLLDQTDSPVYSQAKYPLIRRNEPHLQESLEAYLEKADEKYILENGMRMLYLKEVEIKGTLEKTKQKSMFSSSANSFIDKEIIEKNDRLTAFDLATRLPSVVIKDDQIAMRVMGEYIIPMIIVNNTVLDSDALKTISARGIERMESSKTGYNLGLLMAKYAIIVILKDEIPSIYDESENIKTITPLGYQITKEFYSPKYETKEEKESETPDLRTTIYWNPDVKTNEKGIANVEFFSADTSSSYSVIVEGITDDGRLIYSREKVKISN